MYAYEEQAAAIRKQIRKIAMGLRSGEMFAAYELPKVAPNFTRPKFAMCSPVSGDDANPLTQGPKLLRARFEKRFMMPLEEYVASLADLLPGRSTPLLEVVREVDAGNEFREVTGRRVIHIAGDMLQNADGVSQYHGRFRPYVDFAKTARGKELSADLHGVELVIDYVINPRATNIQRRQHIEFYRQYAAASGRRADVSKHFALPDLPLVKSAWRVRVPYLSRRQALEIGLQHATTRVGRRS